MGARRGAIAVKNWMVMGSTAKPMAMGLDTITVIHCRHIRE